MGRTRKGIGQIEEYRALVELRLSVLLEQYGSDLTGEDYKTAVFNWPDQVHSRSYLLDSLDVFGTDVEHASDEVISIIQDAWNYFPHKYLNGKCPAEILQSMQE